MGAAHLFVCLKPQDRFQQNGGSVETVYGGFCVLRPETSFTGNRGLHIWAAYSENSGLSDRLAEIEAMAKEQGFSQVTFSSNRKGWGRRLKDYEPTYQIYRKML
jgi:hypothetical protein